MIRRLLRRALRVSLFLVLAIATILAATETVYSMHETRKAAKMNKLMKTVCVGRFLIDVPADAEITIGSTQVGGLSFVPLGAESRAQFDVRVAERAAQIDAQTNRAGKANMEAVKPFRSDSIDGTAFVFDRTTTSYYEGSTQIMLSSVAFEAFLHGKDASFSFVVERIDPAYIDEEVELVSQIEPLADGVLPTGPGFCLEGALMRDPISARQAEKISMLVGLPGHPDIGISLATMAGLKPEEGLLARNEANMATFNALTLALKLRMSTLSAQARAINGLSGEELLFKTREANLTTGYGFTWEHQGDEHNVFNPYVELILQAGTNPRAGGPPVQTSMAEADLLDLWQRITNSLRLRPVEQPRARPTDSAPALGTVAMAGSACPASGWWRCSPAGAQVGVLGGQRQYFRASQTLPQALMLPAQSAWEKLRRVQPSFESAGPTAWTLDDRRATPRCADVSALAMAGPVAPCAAMGTAQPGQSARSGAPCPASGWWRCDDAQALDGARWFAQGAALPPATFRLAGEGAPWRGAERVQLIQRRSNWRLVRLADSAG